MHTNRIKRPEPQQRRRIFNVFWAGQVLNLGFFDVSAECMSEKPIFTDDRGVFARIHCKTSFSRVGDFSTFNSRIVEEVFFWEMLVFTANLQVQSGFVRRGNAGIYSEFAGSVCLRHLGLLDSSEGCMQESLGLGLCVVSGLGYNGLMLNLKPEILNSKPAAGLHSGELGACRVV